MVSTGVSKTLSLGSNPSSPTMIKFKYQGKIIETPNLDKKLKRMKINLEDIEIIKDITTAKQDSDEKNEKRKVVIRSRLDDILRVCYIDASSSRPEPKELLLPHKWNPKSRTGIVGYTDEFLNSLYYEEGNS